jgi:glycerate-2-kinase
MNHDPITEASSTLLRRMFDAAIASAQAASCVPPHLAALAAMGRCTLIVIGAGKASAAMARAVEDHWPGSAGYYAAFVTGQFVCPLCAPVKSNLMGLDGI